LRPAFLARKQRFSTPFNVISDQVTDAEERENTLSGAIFPNERDADKKFSRYPFFVRDDARNLLRLVLHLNAPDGLRCTPA